MLTRSPWFIELLKESKTNMMMIVYFILINFLDFTCLHNYHCQYKKNKRVSQESRLCEIKKSLTFQVSLVAGLVDT